MGPRNELSARLYMASVIAGSLFNAVPFTSVNEAEIKRHNKAREDLAKAKEKWYENEVAKKR